MRSIYEIVCRQALEAASESPLVGGSPQSPLAASLVGKTMHSIIEILSVETKTGKAKKTGNDYSITEAQCVLRSESGGAPVVGVLVVPKGMEDVAKVGTFTASFALEAARYGEDQGRIVARLTGLIPVQRGQLSRNPAPAA